MFINHNQNPAKESVKITVGRLLVVSSIAPLSQREGALMPSSGLSSNFSGQSNASLDDQEPMKGQEAVWVHSPGYGAPRNLQWAKMMEVKKRVGLS